MDPFSTNARQAQPSDNRHRTARSGAVSPAVLAMLAFGFVFSFLIVLAWVGRSSPASPAAAAASEVVGDGRPTRFSSPNGYTVAIPAGWEPVPDALLQRAAALASNGAASGGREWEAGFQSHADPVLPRNPYVLFSVMPYPTDRQPTVSEIAADLPPCAGLDNSSTGKSIAPNIASVETARRVLGSAVNQIAWDNRTKTVTLPMPPGADGSETIGSMHFGRHALVVVTIYGDASVVKFDTLQATFNAMQNSFHFDDGFAYDENVNADGKTREADGSN